MPTEYKEKRFDLQLKAFLLYVTSILIMDFEQRHMQYIHF